MLLVLAAAIVAADPTLDLFCRPRPHGPEANGAVVGVYAGRTRLLFGQPLVVELWERADPGKRVHIDLYAYRNWGPPSATLRVVDAAGQVIAGEPVALPAAGRAWARLLPDAAHAVGGRLWKPGTYRIRATVETQADAGNRSLLGGRWESNELVVTVADPGATADDLDQAGRRAAAAIASLSATELAGREAASRELTTDHAWDILPAVLAARRTAERGTAARLDAVADHHRVAARQVWPVIRVAEGVGHEPHVFTWAAALPEPTRTRLAREVTGRVDDAVAVRFAEYAPIRVPQDRPLKADEADALTDDLLSRDPAVRLLAARSVPPDPPAGVLAALLPLLADEYRESVGYVHPYPAPYLAPRVADEVVRLGPAVLAGVFDHYEKHINAMHRQAEFAKLLGRLGPDPRSATRLQKLFDEQRHNSAELAAVLSAWGRWGETGARALAAAVPVVRKNAYLRPALADVATELGNTRHPAARPPLLLLLDDADERLVVEAIGAARRVGGPELRDALGRLRTDDRERVRRLAAWALDHPVKP